MEVGTKVRIRPDVLVGTVNLSAYRNQIGIVVKVVPDRLTDKPEEQKTADLYSVQFDDYQVILLYEYEIERASSEKLCKAF